MNQGKFTRQLARIFHYGFERAGLQIRSFAGFQKTFRRRE
jgi:hypothetical protein